jgi:23S rRNA (adenine-N6)-dimethyltransferase
VAGRVRRPELGQHFLRNRGAIARLVELAGIGRADFVVEVGPGRGALTYELARRAGRVVAVELDPELAAELRGELAGVANIDVVTADFLTFAPPREDHVVVGNIPYAHTAAILRKVDASRPRAAWLIVQREAAERFAGQPWGSETLQSLALKPWWHIEVRGALRRTDFDPPPRVESALLSLQRRERPLVTDARPYRAFLERSFGAGSVGDGLRRSVTRQQLHRLANDLRFSPAAPPSSLTFEQWLAVYRFVAREVLV